MFLLLHLLHYYILLLFILTEQPAPCENAKQQQNILTFSSMKIYARNPTRTVCVCMDSCCKYTQSYMSFVFTFYPFHSRIMHSICILHTHRVSSMFCLLRFNKSKLWMNYKPIACSSFQKPKSKLDYFYVFLSFAFLTLAVSFTRRIRMRVILDVRLDIIGETLMVVAVVVRGNSSISWKTKLNLRM